MSFKRKTAEQPSPSTTTAASSASTSSMQTTQGKAVPGDGGKRPTTSQAAITPTTKLVLEDEAVSLAGQPPVHIAEAAEAIGDSGKTGAISGRRAKNTAGGAAHGDTPQAGGDAGVADEPTEPGTARRLGEALLDERDDVLSVINELEDQLDRYEEIRERLERELAQTDEQRANAQAAVQKLEWQIRAYRTQAQAHEQLRQEAALFEERIADANHRVQRLEAQLDETEAEKQHLAQELAAARRQLDQYFALQQEHASLKNELSSAIAKRAEAEQAAHETAEERSILRAHLQESQAALEEARHTNQQLETKLRAAKDTIDNLRSTHENLIAKLDNARGEKKTVLSHVAHLERENVRLADKQRHFEREIASLRSKLRAAESEVAEATKAFTAVRAALLETSARTRRRSIVNSSRPVSVTLRGLAADNPEPTEAVSATES